MKSQPFIVLDPDEGSKERHNQFIPCNKTRNHCQIPVSKTLEIKRFEIQNDQE